jgi:Spy/CpxP family protein refolding chaperone
VKVLSVILAVLVIFGAGVVTGGMASKRFRASQPQRVFSPPPNLAWTRERKAEYLQKLDRNLSLTSDQKAKIELILDQSNERMRAHWQKLEPKIKEEYRATRKQVNEILTPEQRKKHEEWRAQRIKNKGKAADPNSAKAENSNSPSFQK